MKHFQVHSLAGFGTHGMTEGLRAAGALLFYLMETQKGSVSHLQPLQVYHLSQFMVLSETTQRHLETYPDLVPRDEARLLDFGPRPDHDGHGRPKTPAMA